MKNHTSWADLLPEEDDDKMVEEPPKSVSKKDFSWPKKPSTAITEPSKAHTASLDSLLRSHAKETKQIEQKRDEFNVNLKRMNAVREEVMDIEKDNEQQKNEKAKLEVSVEELRKEKLALEETLRQMKDLAASHTERYAQLRAKEEELIALRDSLQTDKWIAREEWEKEKALLMSTFESVLNKKF